MSEPMFLPDPKFYDYRFSGHAGAGPSSAERWMTCTHSLRLSREFLETLTPQQQQQFAAANTAARQGTTAHAAAETEIRLLLGHIDQTEADLTLMELAVMPDEESEAYDSEMAETLGEYVDLVHTYGRDRGYENVMIEQRVGASVFLDGYPLDHPDRVYTITGSADCIVLPTAEEPDLVVADLKYGNGIDVSVEGNPQIRIYGLGALAQLIDLGRGLPEQITYHIVQPRLGGIKTWTESTDDLIAWRDEVLSPALTQALTGVGAKFAPSDKACQFCPARGGCPALTEERVAAAADLFDTVVEAEYEHGPGAFPPAESLTDTRLGELLAQITGLIDIHADLKAEAQRRLVRGDAVPGFKLVSYTPPRKWSEDAPARLKRVKALWKEPSLVTPTQALKMLKGDDGAIRKVEDLIVHPDMRPVIAPEHDRRKTWRGTPAEQMFTIMGDTDTGTSTETGEK